jgi:hypothetical protein
MQDPLTESDGGYQRLMISRQNSLNRNTGELTLSEEHQEKIPRYAFDYQNGGWQNRLLGIFERSLGPGLGR